MILLLAAWTAASFQVQKSGPAQAPATAETIAEVAATIQEEALARHLEVLAHDSMQDRQTPSVALERTARYIANQFQVLELTPGAHAGRGADWFQRYPITPTTLDSLTIRQALKQLASANHGVVIATDDDSATFARHREAAQRERRPLAVDPSMIRSAADTNWAVHLRLAAIADLFKKGGIDLERLRLDTIPRLHNLPPFGVSLIVQADTTKPVMTAPNVIGVLEGNDPRFKKQFIVLAVRMDHRNRNPSTADTIDRNHGDNALGIAGLIELAKAFSRPEARPRHSLIFLAVSGSTQDFWGSRYFVGNMGARVNMSISPSI